MKKVFCLLFAVLSVIWLAACSRDSNDITVYEQLAAEDEIMPTLDELGDYVSVKSLCHRGSDLLFSWSGWNLVAEYTEENYALQKARVEKSYLFKDHPYDPGESERYAPREGCPYEVWAGSYVFRGLDDIAYFGCSTYANFPKLVYLIGFDDAEHKIAYIRFHDMDLDAADSLEELLRYAGWYRL